MFSSHRRRAAACALIAAFVAVKCNRVPPANGTERARADAAGPRAAAGPSARPSTGPTAATSEAASSAAPTPGGGSTSAGEYANRLQAVAGIARAVAEAAPRDHDDPGAVLAATGTSVAAIVQWVSTNTRLIAYRGTLRGASGVLMDRSGNSLDRALLTAELLRRAGHTVRLARTKLPPRAAGALRAKIAATTRDPVPFAVPGRARLQELLGSSSLSGPVVDRAVDTTSKESEALARTVRELYGRVAPAVESAAGEDAAERDRDLAIDVEESLTDHFWVQRQSGSGWEDLDPDGNAVGALVPSATIEVGEVPDELKHRVTLRIVMERWEAGALVETTLLERTWSPAELGGDPLTLRHRVYPAPPSLEQLAKEKEPQAAYVEALSRAWVIEPVLTVGSAEVTDRLMTLRDEALPAGQQTLTDLGVADGPAGGFGSRIATGFGQLFGGSQPEPPAPPDEAGGTVKVTAEWLEFEVKVPGRAIERHRRTVFDVLGPARRAAGGAQPPTIDSDVRRQRALALAGETDVLIFGATPAEPWLRRTTARGLADIVERAAAAVRAGAAPLSALSEFSGTRLSLPLRAWAHARSRSPVLSPATPIAPNVALVWSRPTRERDRSRRVAATFDIVANRAASDSRFSRRLAQGVLDTIVEHAIFLDTAPGGNTAALHALDVASGQSWVRLDPRDPGAADRLDAPGDAKARIRDDLSRGYLVIARPHASGATDGKGMAWWRIDPRTGDTVGVGESGFGQKADYALLVTRVSLTGVCAFFALGEIIAGHFSAESAALGLFCVLGPWHAHAAGVAIAEGVIDLLIHLILAAEPPEGHP